MKKRILYYYMFGYSGGGSDNSLYLHLLHLNKKRYTPIVIYKGVSNLVEKLMELNLITHKQKFFATKGEPSLKKVYFKLPYSKTIKFNLRVFIEVFILVKTILEYNIDIIHINDNIKSNRSAAIAGILTFRKIILHDRTGIKLGFFDRVIIKFIYKVIVISESVSKRYNYLNTSTNKITKIYNGIDPSAFDNREKEDGEIIVGYIGRLEKWKGVHIFIHAISEVVEKYKNVKFLIAGEGAELNYLKSLVQQYEVQNSVTFLGYVENVSAFYNKLDVFVHTSIEPEPFGRVIIEAMAAGLPVISTNIGGPKEIITDCKNGFLIKSADSKILAEKIIFLIKNSEIRKKIGNEAILTVKNNFNIVDTTDKIEAIYESIE